MKIAALVLVAASLDISATGAATLQLTAPSHHTPYTGGALTTNVLSAQLQPKPLATGQWSLTLDDPNVFVAPLSISSASAGSWAGSSMTFDEPYFIARSSHLQLAAPVVDDAVNTPSTADFVRDASAMSALEDVFLLNARAHHIWDGRRSSIGGMAMGQADAKVVFWLLQTESVLVEQTHLQIDETTRSAMTWMKTALADPHQSHLFAAGGVNAGDAQKVLDSLNARESNLYALIVNRLGTDVGDPDEAVRKDACQRLKAIVDYYSDIRDGGSPKFAGWERQEVIAATRLASCTGHAITARLQNGETTTQEDFDTANMVADHLTTLVSQSQQKPADSSVVRQAVNRAAELRALGAGH